MRNNIIQSGALPWCFLFTCGSLRDISFYIGIGVVSIGMVMFPGLLVPIPDRGGGVVKMFEKRRLGCVFLAMIAWFRPLWHVPHSVNVARFHFSAVFWNRAASHTPVVAEKCRKTQFGGMKCVGKTHFGRKNVARFEICPENRNRATKFVGSFRGFLFLAGSRGICLSVSYSLHD